MATEISVISVERFTTELYAMFDETFENVHGIYLDSNTSLFETLATVSAEEASRPVSSKCASIAGQVEHVRFFIDVLERYIKGEKLGRVDWQGSWYLKTVTPEEWEALKVRLKDAYTGVLATIKSINNWDGENELGGALSIAIHTAYHLGEIRQALCTIKNG
jgi:hypothetical protein